MSDKRDDRDDDKATSGILGLGGSPVPKSPADPKASDDEESVARRRSRMSGEGDTITPEDPDRQRSGATGIDMGAGGQGTHIERKP